MSLYPDQIAASENFEAWLNGSDELSAGLWASAGFGKSYSARHLVQEVINKNSNYVPVITSMTHSAVEVLSDFLDMPVHTLHSVMGWVPQVNKETGEEYLSTPKMRDKNAEPRLEAGQIVIVDEAGLMGHQELKLLQTECLEVGARILFIGDNKQCFPVVKEDERLCVPAYEATDCYLELTIPKRVDEGDMIYKLSLAYRAAVDGERQPRLQDALNHDGSGKGVRIVDDIEEYAYLAFKAGVRDGNTSNIKVLAFTNDRCINLNRKIRKKVLGIKSPIPVVGEEMVANTSIAMSTGEDVLIRNNQKVIVKEVEETDSFGLKGAFIQFTDLEGADIEEIVFVPASPTLLRERLRKLANEAKEAKVNSGSHVYNEQEQREFTLLAQDKWRAFYSLKEGCADIRFTYAMTINKAQGTTLKHALIDLVDIGICRDREQATRLAYTGVTRATDYVTIEGELKDV